jgi:FAD/FMN-containing dehydrogenase
LLQAKVILANGSLVTASPNQNPDLFFAIRGGGPGTYGVVVETTIKAWPTTSAVAQTLLFAPLTSTYLPEFMDALADLYQSFPSLAKAGWSGYGDWSTSSASALFGNFTIGYEHTIVNFRLPQNESEASFQPMLQKLQQYNGTKLYVYLLYTSVPTYAEYYSLFSGVEPAAGTLGADGSRFLDEKALTGNRTALVQALNITAGTLEEYTVNTVEFFGAPYGQVAIDRHISPISGLNPAWRSMIVHQIVSRGWTQNTSQSIIDSIHYDITYVKEAALKKLAPDTGCYMNEADRLDPDWQVDFYGSHYARLKGIKKEYDPQDVFYCPTCVGSEKFVEKSNGQLCRV